jgi:type II secretory pathway component PulF
MVWIWLVLRCGGAIPPILLVIAALAALIFVREKYAAGQTAFASLLRISIEHNLPLAPMLRAFAEEHGMFMGERVRGLAWQIEQGCPLADALAAEPRLVPRELRLVIARHGADQRMAASSNRVQESLGRIDDARRQLAATLMLIGAFMMVFSSVNTFVVIMLVPSMEKMLRDFGIPGDFGPLGSSQFRILMLLSSVLFLPGFLLSAYSFVVSSGWLRLPLESWILPRLDHAAVLRALATAAAQDVPFRTALEPMAPGFPRRRTAKALHDAVAAIDAGGAWTESLRQFKFVTAREQALFASAERAGNLSATLDETAASIEHGVVARLGAVNNVLGVVAVLVFGSFTLLAALPIFYTLILSIECLL